MLRLDSNQSQPALDDLQKALNSDPNYAMAYIVSGAVYNYIQQFDNAIRSLERGIALLTRKRRKAISDAIIETRAKLSAVNIPAADTKSTFRRYSAANGDVAASVTSTGERRTLRLAREDGRRVRTSANLPPTIFVYSTR